MTQTATTQPDTEPETTTALITGGDSVIGRAAAMALASEGHEVAIARRTAATLEETVTLITQAGGMAKYVIADVHGEDAVRRAVEFAAAASADDGGRLDVAVNSAGVNGDNDVTGGALPVDGG